MKTRFLNTPFVQFLRHSVELYFDQQIPRVAATMAYFLLLTMFPFLICINAFLGLLHLDISDVFHIVSGLFPEVSLDILDGYLRYITVNQSGALLAAGLIMAVFSSSSAFRTLMRAMSDLYGKPSYAGFRKFLTSFLFAFLLILTVYLSISVILTGSWFLDWLSTHIAFGQRFHFWSSLRFLLLFCVFLLFVLAMSHLAAPKGTPRGPLLLGSLISATALVGASALFSFFIGLSTRYSLVYGSLVSFIVLMVWLYLCGNILLLGNVLSSVWYRRHAVSKQISQKKSD